MVNVTLVADVDSTDVEFVNVGISIGSFGNSSSAKIWKVEKFAKPVKVELSKRIHKNIVRIFGLISSFSFGISDFTKT